MFAVIFLVVFIARQHTDARYWYSKSVRLSVRLSDRPSVRPWRSGIRWKRLNVSSQFFSPYGSPIILVLSASNILQNSDGVIPCGALNTGGVEIFRDFLPISRYISQMIQDIAIVTKELVRDLSNGAISNDLERTLTPFSRSHHSFTLNISQTATDTVIVTIEGK